MGGRCKRRQPVPGDSGAGPAEKHAPVPGLTVPDVDAGPTESGGSASGGGEKVYLGVRVKRPVRDLLRKIRTDQGLEPQDLQKIYGKKVKGNGPRGKRMRAARRGFTRKRSTKSLEELAILVEVLEEDLRTGGCSPQALPSPRPPVSPDWASTGSGYNSDESDDMIPSPDSYAPYWPAPAEHQEALWPGGFMPANPPQPPASGAEPERVDARDGDWNRNNSTFFWAQLQREENQLEDIGDAALLEPDGHGKTALHKVACVGKRALGYALAKRMAAFNSLDLKDFDGMTPLLHAAKHNHHLMVADLILLGANVNEANNSGKTCLHLSAERGYTRVLEVLKSVMLDGVFVDVEASDNSGMSVLQCASVALKAAVRKLECSEFPNPTRLQTLHQEQMMETLECLLQMGSYPHVMGSLSMQPRCG